MPHYRFENLNTSEEEVLFMSISELEEYLKTNPHIQQLINGAPAIGDSIRLGLRKPDDAFRDRLKEIKKAHDINWELPVFSSGKNGGKRIVLLSPGFGKRI